MINWKMHLLFDYDFFFDVCMLRLVQSNGAYPSINCSCIHATLLLPVCRALVGKWIDNKSDTGYCPTHHACCTCMYVISVYICTRWCMCAYRLKVPCTCGSWSTRRHWPMEFTMSFSKTSLSHSMSGNLDITNKPAQKKRSHSESLGSAPQFHALGVLFPLQPVGNTAIC